MSTQQRPGASLSTVILIAMLTSVVSSIATVFIMAQMDALPSPPAEPATPQPTALASPPPVPSTPAESDKLPALVGHNENTARELLKGQGHTLVISERRMSVGTAHGVILEQKPHAGTSLPPGSEVSVVLSTSPSHVEIPEVVGKKLEVAKRALGLRKLVVTSIEGDEGELVTGVDPAAGTSVPSGSGVTLTLGARLVEVPRLNNVHIRRARKMITDAGFKVGTVQEHYYDNRKGYVIVRQSPKAGELVPRGSEINLIMSEGD